MACCFALFGATFCGLAAAQGALAESSDSTFPVFEISYAGPDRVDAGTQMGYLIDATREISIADVQLPGTTWRRIERRSPNFGFTRDAYWFRFQINNTSVFTTKRYVELPMSFIDDMQLFHFVAGRQVADFQTGDEKPFSTRPMVHQNFVLPVLLQPGLNQLYIRLQNAGTIEAPFRIWEPTAFQEANQLEKLAQGMVVGVLLVMIFYNLFVYFSTRDTNYLFYILFVGSYLLFQYSLTGYTYAHLWPEAVWWNSVAIPTFLCITEMAIALFCINFLRVRTFSVWVYKSLRAVVLLTAAMAFLSLVLPYSISVRIAAGMAIPLASFCLWLGYWRWWQGESFARLFCVAWTLALLGVVVLAASKFGAVPANFWTENALQMGILGLVVLLSFTLADRINHDRDGLIKAQASALLHAQAARTSQEALTLASEEANRKLEQRVKERTEDLYSTLDQLQAAHTQLQRLSMTDGLTKIDNRASFDKALLAEFKRAVRQQTPLTLIMMDIDYFKKVNDSWGHLAGDACLQALAKLMQTFVHRAGDMVARYGGEEFVVILGDTQAADARAFAEKCRVAIEALVLDYEGQDLRFTASMGVVTVTPNEDISPQLLLAAADKALYEAKKGGRNRVCVAPSL